MEPGDVVEILGGWEVPFDLIHAEAIVRSVRGAGVIEAEAGGRLWYLCPGDYAELNERTKEPQ